MESIFKPRTVRVTGSGFCSFWTRCTTFSGSASANGVCKVSGQPGLFLSEQVDGNGTLEVGAHQGAAFGLEILDAGGLLLALLDFVAVGAVAGEAVDFVDDDEIDVAFFNEADQQALQAGAVGGRRRGCRGR